MEENNKNIPVKSEDIKIEDFKGYTLEELKYQRALIALRKEFCKAQVLQTIDSLRPKRKDNSDSSMFGSKFGLIRTIGSKLFSNLNTLDYIMLGMSAFGTAKKAYSLFRHKK